MPLIGRLPFCSIGLLLLTASVSRGVVTDGMDYGPFISYRVTLQSSSPLSANPAAGKAAKKEKAKDKKPAGPYVAKGISVSLDPDATVCFDTDMLRYAAGWTGGFLDMTDTNVGSKAGHSDAKPIGEIRWTSGNVQGVAVGTSEFVDPRPDSQGPLPRGTAHYRGLYKDAGRVVFSYTVGAVGVLERAWNHRLGRPCAVHADNRD